MAASLIVLVVAVTLQLAAASSDHCPPKPSSLPALIFLGVSGSQHQDCIKEDGDGSECDMYLRMGLNEDDDSFVDFYLEGNQKGWVAVGFSKNKLMFSTDVMGCIQEQFGNISVINTWNPATGRQNDRNPSQDFMCTYETNYTDDNRLSCHFSRYGGVINEGYDYNLNGSYYLILGTSDYTGGSGGFPYHTVIPQVSKSRYNVFIDNASNGTSDGSHTWITGLRKAHGILMLIGWSLLVSTGIFMSSWMKPALPKGRWFQIHRLLMLLSIPVVIIALICVFVSNKDNGVIITFDCGILTSHFVLGVTATVLMLINPIIALLRCGPKSPKRPIFNSLHGLIGGLAIVVGHFAIGTGITYFTSECESLSLSNSIILLIYVIWQLAFVLMVQVVLNIVFTKIAFKHRGKERIHLAPSLVKVCLNFPDEDYTHINNQSYDGEHLELEDQRSEDYKIRLGAFAVYTGVNCFVVIILCYLTAAN